MATWIALLRGINVGGKHIVPMAELRERLESIGLECVRTYIQSGNVVFELKARSAAALAKKIAGCIEEHHGFRPDVLVLTAGDLAAAMEANPFPEATAEPSTLHLSFLTESATDADREAMAELQSATERFELTDAVFYMHAPDGIGRSKLAAKVERCLGVAATGRNWRTVEKLASMVAEG